jgi:hypothetical protein
MAEACLESSQWEKYKQAQMAAYMQMNQEFITSFSSKEVTKIRNLETELAELKEPSPKLITL